MRRTAVILILAVMAAGPGAIGQNRQNNKTDKYVATANNILKTISSSTEVQTGEVELSNSGIGPDGKEIAEDGYVLVRKGRKTTVIGKDKGLVYGVVGLLKDYYGVDYWGEGEFFVAETPTFRYRQTQNYMMKSDSLWVHTCNHLLPADKYGKDLPEKRTGKVEFIPVEGRAESGPAKARYIKVEVTGTKTCPTWHYGVGNPSWFFIDEVIVK